jgi:hypothetical protein
MRKLLAVVVSLIGAYANGLASYDRPVGRPPKSETERVESFECSFAPSRRGLFTAAASSIATFAMSQSATAVDFQAFNVSKFATGPNKQRIGGLAKKIQKSCNIMV